MSAIITVQILSMKIFTISLAGLFCIAVLSGCGGGKRGATKAAEEAANKPDITRPPVLVVDKSDEVVESNPDETVSFDKWQTEEEKKAAEAADPE